MRSTWKLIAIALGAVALYSMALVLAPSASGGELWPGRRILLVAEEIPDSDIRSLLSGAGIKNVICESTQELAFSDYSKLVNLSLTEARSRLLASSGSKDPRLDAYMEGMPSWFHAQFKSKGYRIYYIGRSLASRPLRLQKLLSAYKGNFLLPESGRTGQSALDYLGLGLSLGLFLALIFMKRRGRLFRLLILAAWPLLALRGGPAVPAALLWEAALAASLPRLEALFEECRLSSGARLGQGLRSAVLESWPLLATAFGFFALESSLLPSVLLCLAGSLLGILFLLGLYKGNRVQRRLGFVPLRIARASAQEAARASFSSPWAKLGLAAACLGLALSLAFRVLPVSVGDGAPAGLSLPQPVSLGVGGPRGLPGPQEAARLAASRASSFLPDLSDYLVHRAREESLFYLPLSESRPDPFASLSIPSLGGREAFSKSFDEAWARGAYRAAPSKGVESLLLSEQRFVRAEVLPLGSFRAQPLAPQEGLLYIILMAPPLFSLWFGKKMRRSGGPRENRQAV
jgi:hypothetical protein